MFCTNGGFAVWIAGIGRAGFPLTHDVCHGKPCIRGTRSHGLHHSDYLKAGETIETILRQYPTLVADDICAALSYAAWLAHEEEEQPCTRLRQNEGTQRCCNTKQVTNSLDGGGSTPKSSISRRQSVWGDLDDIALECSGWRLVIWLSFDAGWAKRC